MAKHDEHTHTTHYSIMPDFGGEYLWLNAAGTELLSWWGNTKTAASVDQFQMSDVLEHDFKAWQGIFECAGRSSDNSKLDIDWVSFHAQGLALAKRLKAELGDAGRVFYVKPFEDPNEHVLVRQEVLLDGSVIHRPIPYAGQLKPLSWFPYKIISGGQTGVDRAALDWAIDHYIEHGGWCPKGRVAVDGVLASCYQLTETTSSDYRQRTKFNVRDSDATLILNLGELDGGTLQTSLLAKTLEKPCRVFQLDQDNLQAIALEVIHWLGTNQFKTLNIAGPREERRPGSYAKTLKLLDFCFDSTRISLDEFRQAGAL